MPIKTKGIRKEKIPNVQLNEQTNCNLFPKRGKKKPYHSFLRVTDYVKPHGVCMIREPIKN